MRIISGMKKPICCILLAGLCLMQGCTILPRVANLAPIDPQVELKVDKPNFVQLDELLKVYHKSSSQPLKERLAEHKDTLDRLAAMCAAPIGPTSNPENFPNPTDRLAWLYNVRTVFSLYFILECPDDQSLKDWYAYRNFLADGETLDMRIIDTRIEDEFGYRAVVTAPYVMPGWCALPQKHFTADNIEQAVKDNFNDYIDDDSCVKIDYAGRKIRFGRVLWRYRHVIMDEHKKQYGAEGAAFTSALLPLTSGSAHRRLQDAVGYKGTLLK